MADDKKAQDEFAKRAQTIARWTKIILLIVLIVFVLCSVLFLAIYRYRSGGNGDGSAGNTNAVPYKTGILTHEWQKQPIAEGTRCEPFAIGEDVQIAIRQNGDETKEYVLERYGKRTWRDGTEVTKGKVPVRFILYKANRDQDAGQKYGMKCSDIKPSVTVY